MTDEPTPTGDAGAVPTDEAAAVARTPAAGAADAAGTDGSTPTTAEYTVAFSPRNVAVGLAIVAGLVGLLVRRRRRGRGG